jgi:hypothetical protein
MRGKINLKNKKHYMWYEFTSVNNYKDSTTYYRPKTIYDENIEQLKIDINRISDKTSSILQKYMNENTPQLDINEKLELITDTDDKQKYLDLKDVSDEYSKELKENENLQSEWNNSLIPYIKP